MIRKLILHTVILTLITNVFFSNACSLPCKAADSLNVVYFGGSSTVGVGLYNTWMEQANDYLSLDGAVNINSHYAGLLGTGSAIGLLRMHENVIAKNPDLVFIEFAADDSAETITLQYIESIVLSLLSLQNTPDVIFIYSGRNDSNVLGDILINSMKHHHLIAEFYGIPEIDLRYEMEVHWDEMNPFLNDDKLSLSQGGHDFFAQEVIACLQNEESTYRRQPMLKNTKIDERSYAIGDTIYSGYNKYVFASTSYTHKFNGCFIGLMLDKTSIGDYKIIIDGTEYGEFDSAIKKGFASFGLGDGEHSLVIFAFNNSKILISGFYTDADIKISPYIYEDFEDEGFLKSVITGGASVKWDNEVGYGNSKGSARVKVSHSNLNVRFRTSKWEANTTYKMSVKLKIKSPQTIYSDNVTFMVYAKEKVNETWGSTSLVEHLTHYNTGISGGDWVTVERYYTPTEIISEKNYMPEVAIALRIGNTLESVTGSSEIPFEFYMDDYIVEPIYDSEYYDGNLLKSTFDINEEPSIWSSMNSATIEHSFDAPIDRGYIKISGGQYSGIVTNSRYAIMPNRKYKISFYAKATNETSYGREVVVSQIYTNSSNQQVNYTKSSGLALSYEWQKFELVINSFTSGISNVGAITEDFQKVKIRFLLSSLATETNISLAYDLDEICITPYERIYNGSFETSDISHLKTISKGVRSVILDNEDLGADNQIGYLKTNNVIATQVDYCVGADILAGKRYKVSFWARVDSIPYNDNGTPNNRLDDFAAPNQELSVGVLIDRRIDGTVYPNDVISSNVGNIYINSEDLGVWKYFEYEFEAQSPVDADYRSPFLSIRIGDSVDNPACYANYSLDEIKLELCEDIPKVANLEIIGFNQIGEILTISYSYNYCSDNFLGNAGFLYRVLSSNDGKQQWATIKTGETFNDSFDYRILYTDYGKFLRFEVVALDENGTKSEIAFIQTSKIQEGGINITLEFENDVWTDEINGIVSIVNNSYDTKCLSAVIAVYGNDNQLTNIVMNDLTVYSMQNLVSNIIAIPKENDSNVKLMVLNDFNGLKPMCVAKELYK